MNISAIRRYERLQTNRTKTRLQWMCQATICLVLLCLRLDIGGRTQIISHPFVFFPSISTLNQDLPFPTYFAACVLSQ